MSESAMAIAHTYSQGQSAMSKTPKKGEHQLAKLTGESNPTPLKNSKQKQKNKKTKSKIHRNTRKRNKQHRNRLTEDGVDNMTNFSTSNRQPMELDKILDEFNDGRFISTRF